MTTSFRERVTNPSPRRALAVGGTVILVAMLVPFVLFAVPQVVGADHGFVILSGSMEPAISPGDVVIVDASAAVAVGDVITFRDGSIPTTHRVVAVQDGAFVTQGDANEDPDAALVAPESVLGQVVLTIPLLGHVILWANSPLGYVSLVVVPLGLLVGSELLAWARRDGTEAAGGAAVAATDETSESTPDAQTVAVAVADLKLSVLATTALLAYAGWSIYGEVQTLGVPDPISVAAGTAGLLGAAFAGWVTLAAYRAGNGADAPARAEPRPTAETDGGSEEVER